MSDQITTFRKELHLTDETQINWAERYATALAKCTKFECDPTECQSELDFLDSKNFTSLREVSNDCSFLGFEMHVDGSTLVIRSEEDYGEPERAALVLQEFIKHHRPHVRETIEWKRTPSKGEPTRGRVLVTRDILQYGEFEDDEG